MSEYRRFISYIYDYPQGRKGSNCGYAKAEVRGGVFRLRLHLQPQGASAGNLKVYCFVREKGLPSGILLGNAAPRAGAWEFQSSCPAANIGGTRYGMDDLRGIWLRGSEAENYISVWDDEPVRPEQFTDRLPEEPAGPEASAGPQEQPAEDVPEASGAPQERPAGELPGASGASQEQPAENVPEVSGALRKRPAGVLPEVSGTSQERPVDALSEASAVSQERPAGNLSGASATSQERPAGVLPEASGASPGSLAGRWENFLCHYPQMQPFSDGEIVQCIRISPKDLSFLQPQEWRFSQNTFLRQAYMQYHHLMLGRHESGRFLLAVPGTCRDKQEQHLARMYGFPFYKEAAHAAPEEDLQAADVQAAASGGAKPDGYWYHFL